MTKKMEKVGKKKIKKEVVQLPKNKIRKQQKKEVKMR